MSMSINANAAVMQPPINLKISLTTEQVELISDTLAEFNPDTLTEADAATIVNRFSEAGIQPSRELAQAMDEAGFNARNIGDLAGVGPRAGESSGQMTNIDQAQMAPQNTASFTDEMLTALEELLEEYSDKVLTSENKETILTTMQDRFSLTQGQSLFSFEA